MDQGTMIDDLYRYNDWANGRILRLCDGLSDEQLDQPREMGFGSLRATVFHILAAEEVWLERWAGEPWRPFPFDPQGIALNLIGERLKSVSERRRMLVDQERATKWQRMVTYLNSERREGTRRLGDLLVHVANHGVHHRAQALHYLKHFGRTVPVGLDYLVYKLAYPSIKQDTAAVESKRQYGLEAELGPGMVVQFDRYSIQDYFAYHDWANRQVLQAAISLETAALDRDFAIGSGTLRKTLKHLYDVEPYWIKNWGATSAASEVDHVPKEWDATKDGTFDLHMLQQAWSTIASQRNEFVAQLDDSRAAQTVLVVAGGPAMKFQLVESLIQICTHGTHHRAQISNMLRQSGIQPPTLDYAFWVNQRDSKTA